MQPTGPHLSSSHSTTSLAAATSDRSGPVKRKHVAIETIPGVIDSGWRAELHGAFSSNTNNGGGSSSGRPYRLLLSDGAVHEAGPGTLQRLMEDLLQLVGGQEDAWPFREPVAIEQAPDYYEVIKNPVRV